MAKQLGEFLQLQQEPFTLEGYLSERGYVRNSSNSSHNIPSEYLNSSASCPPYKSKNSVGRCTRLLRAVYSKIVSINERVRAKNFEDKGGKSDVGEMGKKSIVAEVERCSSTSSTSVFKSCSESGIEEAWTSLQKDTFTTSHCSASCHTDEKKAEADRKLQQRSMEDSKQLSQVQHNARTMEEVNSSTSRVILPKKITEDAKLSAFLKELLLSVIEKPNCGKVAEAQGLLKPNANSQYRRSKHVLQQCKQLLFDCVREIIEKQGLTHSKQQYREFLGSEELEKLICKKIKIWGKQSGNETNITELLSLDLSAEEWSDYKPHRKKIALAIGDTIFGEIKDEVVTNMIDLLSSTRF